MMGRFEEGSFWIHVHFTWYSNWVFSILLNMFKTKPERKHLGIEKAYNVIFIEEPDFRSFGYKETIFLNVLRKLLF